MAPKTVCIVGVAGFIGSHLLEKIIREKDWHVIGVDMVAPNKIQQLLGAEKKWASRFEFHQVSLGNARLAGRAVVLALSDAGCKGGADQVCKPTHTRTCTLTPSR